MKTKYLFCNITHKNKLEVIKVILEEDLENTIECIKKCVQGWRDVRILQNKAKTSTQIQEANNLWLKVNEELKSKTHITINELESLAECHIIESKSIL